MKTYKTKKSTANSTKKVAASQALYNRLMFIGLIAAMIAAGFGLALGISNNQTINSGAQITVNNELRLAHKTERIQFCYDRDIKPCDDASIEKVNATLDEADKFSLTPIQYTLNP